MKRLGSIQAIKKKLSSDLNSLNIFKTDGNKNKLIGKNNIIIDKTSAVNEFLNSISEEEKKKWNICEKPINNKTSLKISPTGQILLENVFIPKSNCLQNTNGWSSVFSCFWFATVPYRSHK